MVLLCCASHSNPPSTASQPCPLPFVQQHHAALHHPGFSRQLCSRRLAAASPSALASASWRLPNSTGSYRHTSPDTETRDTTPVQICPNTFCQHAPADADVQNSLDPISGHAAAVSGNRKCGGQVLAGPCSDAVDQHPQSQSYTCHRTLLHGKRSLPLRCRLSSCKGFHTCDQQVDAPEA